MKKQTIEEEMKSLWDGTHPYMKDDIGIEQLRDIVAHLSVNSKILLKTVENLADVIGIE